MKTEILDYDDLVRTSRPTQLLMGISSSSTPCHRNIPTIGYVPVGRLCLYYINKETF